MTLPYYEPFPYAGIGADLPSDTTTLTDAETGLITYLQRRLFEELPRLQIRDAYYNGVNLMADLGISIPPQLQGLHTAIGWARLAVDAIEERLDIEGFRYPGSTDADEDLWNIWQSNCMDEEAPLAHLDSLVFGRAYACVGARAPGLESPLTTNSQPLITVESPLTMTAVWHPLTRTIQAAYREYWYEGQYSATLYTPNSTVTLERDANYQWTSVYRDQHNLGLVPVVRLANRQRVSDRYGISEITPEIMEVTDSACRTLLAAEVAREFYAAPQRYILGATEEAFQAADGTPKTAWETYLGRVLALERDPEGNVPTVGQFNAYDPSVYTKLIDMYAQIMASITGLPPHFLGQSTDGNATSADAIRSSESRLNKKAERKQQSFSGSWEDVLRLALLIRDGSLPDGHEQMETMWASPATPTPAATTDAILKQVQGGIMPPESNVALETLGYSMVQIQRIANDRRRDRGRTILAELANSLQAKQAKTDLNVTKDIASGSDIPGLSKPTPVTKPANDNTSGAR